MNSDLTAMTPEQCKQRLRELIINKALSFGDFTLASGRKSSYYIDCRPVTLDGEGAYLLARCLLELLEDEDIEAVGGMAIGADPISAATSVIAAAMGRKLDAFIVRKEPKDHGTGRQVEGPLSQGARVAMVEDTVTTGGSTLRAIAALQRERNAEVVLILVMVDRQEGAREAFEEAGYRFVSLFTVEDLGVKLEP